MIKHIDFLRDDTELGRAHMSTCISRKDYEIVLSEDGQWTFAKCTAKTIKPECSGCGIFNAENFSV